MFSDEILECKVKVEKVIYPRGRINCGDFGILSVKPVEIFNGEPMINYMGCITIKGNLPEINLEDNYSFTGKLIDDTKYGYQYDVIDMGIHYNLTDDKDKKLFLSKILSEPQLESLYETYDDPFILIEKEDLNSLCKVKGVGKTTAEKIIQKFKDNIDYSKIMIELNEYGLTRNMIDKLVARYKNPSVVIEKVRKNPYLLASEVDGIGFKKADQIAMNSGLIAKDSRDRIVAFINFHFEQEAQNGNSWLYPSDVLYAVEDIMDGEGLAQKYFRGILYDLKENDTLYWNKEKTFICLKKYYDLEVDISKELLRLLDSDNSFEYDNFEEDLKTIEAEQGFEFDESQLASIKTGLNSNVLVITGNAGCGKSSVINAIVKILDDYKFALTALSGKAATRMEELTGNKGWTIHKLLGFIPGEGFSYNKECPMMHDIIILDEVSMVGGELFYQLIQSIKDGAKLIMVGDHNQLESIGAMNILKDLIDCNVVPICMLTKIHRQAAKSGIITESLKVKDGIQIVKNGWSGEEIRGELQDFILDIYDDRILTVPKILNWVKKERGTYPNIMDLQVIVPMKEMGEACTFELNNELQKIFNPWSKDKEEIEITKKKKKYILREGDKVINMVNKYSTKTPEEKTEPIFNGYMGIVKSINDTEMIVDFDLCGKIIIPRKLYRNIELGYACTVHKYQGSQVKIGIIAIDYSSFNLLTKQMIYTAVTRSSKKCILIAEEKALRFAISNDNIIKKQTFLKDLLLNSIK